MEQQHLDHKDLINGFEHFLFECKKKYNIKQYKEFREEMYKFIKDKKEFGLVVEILSKYRTIE